MKSLFFGGVHPDGRKELSAAVPLTAMALPAQVAVPLRQHIGTPCKPLVAPGDTVCMGQKIGDGEGLCVPVHAPVSGTVEAPTTLHFFINSCCFSGYTLNHRFRFQPLIYLLCENDL